MRRRIAGLGAVAASLAVLVGLAAPASAATISSGHVDILDVDKVGSALTLSLRTYGATPDDAVAPSGTTIAVPAAARTTVPSSTGYACLGAAGSPVHLLPQSESAASASGLVWGGWNTEGVADSPASVQLEIDVAGSTVPVGGRFALYTTSLGAVSYKLSTSTASGCAAPSFQVARNAHAHGFWAFTQPGTYALKLRATGTGVSASPWETYTFVVG